MLVRIVIDAMADRPLPGPTVEPAPELPGSVVDGAVAYIRSRGISDDAPAEAVMRTLMAWTAVFGTVSFELFGHYVGSVGDHERYFDLVVQRLAADIGFAAAG